MNKESLPCIACRKTLYRVFDDIEYQPNNGVMCRTRGNYGSAIYDNFIDSTILVFNLCDECLAAAGEAGAILEARELPQQFKVTDNWSPDDE